MLITEMVEEIKIDLGCDINSLGISDNSIEVKIKEAVRKISTYAPYVCTETLPVTGGYVQMPEDTMIVINVLNKDKNSASTGQVVADDTNLFSVSRYLYNYNDLSDPYIFLMQKNAVSSLQQFVESRDGRYDKESKRYYLSNFDGVSATVQYLRKYRSLEEIEDIDIIQVVKEYSLALCKIIEGNIRRKLQSAPGAIQLDGDALVSEGISEKNSIEDSLARRFQHLRFGMRC